ATPNSIAIRCVWTQRTGLLLRKVKLKPYFISVSFGSPLRWQYRRVLRRSRDFADTVPSPGSEYLFSRKPREVVVQIDPPHGQNDLAAFNVRRTVNSPSFYALSLSRT